jgi:hypothetical protein
MVTAGLLMKISQPLECRHGLRENRSYKPASIRRKQAMVEALSNEGGTPPEAHRMRVFWSVPGLRLVHDTDTPAIP